MSPKDNDGSHGEPNPESSEGLTRFLVKGIFVNASFPSGAYRFNGDFTVDDLSGRLLGATDDKFGKASIIGERLPEALCFTKIYNNRNPNSSPITYQFTRNGKGIWVGLYTYTSPFGFGSLHQLTGNAQMKEHPYIGDVTTRKNFDFVHRETMIDLDRIRIEYDETIGRILQNLPQRAETDRAEE